jgi:hypothetical protein
MQWGLGLGPARYGVNISLTLNFRKRRDPRQAGKFGWLPGGNKEAAGPAASFQLRLG